MMKFLLTPGLVATSFLLMSASLMAQGAAEDKPAPKRSSAKEKAVEEETPRDLSYLPKPLSDIRTNILDLERQGYFAIDEVDFRTRGSGDEAVVWTVRVKKAVTCRHIEVMLREFRDVRFQTRIEKQNLEVLATLGHYSDRVSLGSSRGSLLRQDDVFELWIDLPMADLQKLISLRANRLVLGRWRY